VKTQRIDALNRLLDQVVDAFTPTVAKRIIQLRAGRAIQRRLDDLADPHHEGELSAKELEEYESLVDAITLIGLIQAKTRIATRTRTTHFGKSRRIE